MPAKHSIHEAVVRALQNDGWTITHDPLPLNVERQILFVDLGAHDDNLLAADRDGRSIAIEIKTFTSGSAISSLYLAVGQYVVYQLVLSHLDPDRTLYLAVAESALDAILATPVGCMVVSELPMNLIVVDTNTCEIVQWIEQTSTRES